MLVACGLPASAAGGPPACGSDLPQGLAAAVVEISVPPLGFGEIGLTMADGQRYLIAGVVVPAPASARQRREAVDQLRAMLQPPVQFNVTDDAPDRRGRRIAAFFSGSTPVAARLAAMGLVLASGVPCSGTVVAAEAEARAARRGLWADADFLYEARRADMDLPDFAVITGSVLSVGQSGQTTYLNFGTSFRRDVTVRVPDATRLALEAGGVDVAAMAGKQVEFRGYWMAHDGPELVLQHVEALSLPTPAGGGR